jgi:hypothetical protein
MQPERWLYNSQVDSAIDGRNMQLESVTNALPTRASTLYAKCDCYCR